MRWAQEDAPCLCYKGLLRCWWHAEWINFNLWLASLYLYNYPPVVICCCNWWLGHSALLIIAQPTDKTVTDRYVSRWCIECVAFRTAANWAYQCDRNHATVFKLSALRAQFGPGGSNANLRIVDGWQILRRHFNVSLVSRWRPRLSTHLLINTRKKG